MIFSAATECEPDGPNRWRAQIHPGWDIAGNANGGYLLALAARAMLKTAGRSDVATITAHFLRPGPAGPISIDTEVVKAGRRFSTVRATLANHDPLISVIGSFTELDHAADDRSIMLAGPPELPPVESTPRASPGEMFPPPLMANVDLRIHPEDNFSNGPSGNPRIRGWLRFADDEVFDSVSLLLAADVFPPTVFNTEIGMGWTPTLELTVHVRQRPAPGWLRCEFRTRFVTGGFLEEDGTIWDSEDRLVAQSRQIALLPRT